MVQPITIKREDIQYALSIQQPWAWLIANGYKNIENRSWKSTYRGYFLIHAGKTFDREGYEWILRSLDKLPRLNALPKPNEYPRGGIVGLTNMVDCVNHSMSPWFFGKWGFVLTDSRPLTFQACRGALRFFKPSFTSGGPSIQT